MELEKGQFFRTHYKSKINYVIDVFTDEDTGKLIYEVANPTIEADGKRNYYIEAESLDIYKASRDVYDIIDNRDLLQVFINDIDYLTQVRKEEDKLVAYIEGKKYTLEELKQLDAINTIYGMQDLLLKGLNLRDLEE